jgi:hypothetical protein
MGSNSFRRIVGSYTGGRYQQGGIEVRTLGVGDDVARNGRIGETKLSEIDAALEAFAMACARDGAAPVVAVGTAAFRDAANGAEVVKRAAALGVSMEIASERRESELAYLVGALGEPGYAVVDNGSRSIELVAADGAAPQYLVATLGYRVAYDRYFADATEPAAAVQAFRHELEQAAAKAPFMRARRGLIGLEFGEMLDLFFTESTGDPVVITATQLRAGLAAITGGTPAQFAELKATKDIDRALPRLVSAAYLTEAFGYSQISLTRRELGAGLIIEAGRK